MILTSTLLVLWILMVLRMGLQAIHRNTLEMTDDGDDHINWFIFLLLGGWQELSLNHAEVCKCCTFWSRYITFGPISFKTWHDIYILHAFFGRDICWIYIGWISEHDMQTMTSPAQIMQIVLYRQTLILPWWTTPRPTKPPAASRCACIRYNCCSCPIHLWLCCFPVADVLPAGKKGPQCVLLLAY